MLTAKEHIIKRKVMIMEAGLEHQEVYEKVGIGRIGFYKTLYGKTKNPKVHQAIVDAMISLGVVGVTLETFWPEFYGENAVSHDATVNNQAASVN